MPRRPDMPCATCGELMWRGSSSLPEGQARCRVCRRAARAVILATREPRLPVCARCYGPKPSNRHVYCRPCADYIRRKRGSGTRPSGSTTARGYGRQHQIERAKWKPIVDRGDAYCHAAVCLERDRWIEPGDAWDLGHTEDRTEWTGPEHRRCNRMEGAKRGRRRQLEARGRGRRIAIG